jgi:autotransporter-associated beta strand protein
MKRAIILSGYVAALAAAHTWGFEPVVQSARELPVIRDADVVVVGGGSAAVAAAIAAKTNGASVFLVAPRTYLGDDLAGARELWPGPASEFASQPLAQKIFTMKVPFTYTANVTPNSTHPDAANTRLIDGVKYDAANQSVQYDSNVQITASFAGTGTLSRADVYYYYRPTSTPFDTTVSAVEYSVDGANWSSATISTEVVSLGMIGDITTYVSRVTLAGGVRAMYLRIHCDRGPGATRQLLDELILHVDPNDPFPGSGFSASPLLVKRGLEQALEEAGVPFLGGSLVSDVLKDASGDPAGVVLSNRKGRQAVTARVVIDATENAWPAQRAGGVKTAFAPGAYAFSRIVIADATNAPAAPGLSVVALPGVSYQAPVSGVAAPAGMPDSISGRVYRCTFTTNLLSGSMLELLEVEQAARDLTWAKTCVDQADRVTWLPPDHLVGEASEQTNAWPGAAALKLDAFRPQGVPHLFVLGVRADVSRTLAQALQHPVRLMALADRIGAAAAAEALARGAPAGVTLPAEAGLTAGAEDVREFLAGLPPVNTNAAGAVAEGVRALPVLAECDVLVVGAGTGGAPAAIAAGRAGADTVVIDFLNGMGGVQTDGRIGSYYHGNACGFTVNDVDPGWKATGAVLAQAKAEWYRKACRAAGARVLFGTLAAGAVVEGSDLKGVVVVLPDGTRGVIRAKTVVDSTGNAEIAAAAGEETEFITDSEPAVQGSGWAPHRMGDSYRNSDVGFVDVTDAADIFFFARRAHASMPAATWDAGQNPASRERRRLKGVVTVTPLDILNGRTYPDTIARPMSNFDSHGFTVHDLFFIADPGTSDITANLPYRALLPKTVDGLLVTGLGISAHRDAMPLLRMQRDVQNQGYAAGYASALAVQGGVSVRSVNMAALQAHLVAKGIIGAAHTNTADSFPLAPAVIQTAVEGLTNNYATLHTVLADTATALPMLRAAYLAQTEAAPRLIYAHALGLLRDSTGAAALAAAVSAAAWDTGWNFKGMGQYGRSVSLMDSYLIALGRTLSPSGVAPLMAKTAQLNGSSSFSHIRAASFALEDLDGGSGLAALSTLLTSVRGYALTNAMAAPVIPGYSDTAADAERNACLKELAVARALYKLGDDADGNGGQVLAAYARDPREVYASHARQVLAQGPLNETADGEWIGTGLSADWDNAANWRDGTRAGGVGAAAVFTNAVEGSQTLSLQGAMKTVGSLTFSGADRTVSDGVLDIGGVTPSISVAGGSRVTLATDVLVGGTLVKSGAGELTLSGQAGLGGLDVAEGGVTLRDPAPQFFQAYEADPALHNTGVVGSSQSLRTDFRVNTAVTITGLGAYDSAGDGFENFKKVAIFARAGGAPLAALAFTQGEPYPLESGYRFRRLPQPLQLAPGEYAVVTFGFFGSDRAIEANKSGVGARVGALNDGAGALTFLTNAYYTSAGAQAFPTTAVSPQTDYALTAGSFRFATGASVKSVTGAVTLPAGSKLDVAAVDVRLSGGLLPGAGGLGTVSNASAAHPVTLTLGVPAGQTNEVDASRVGDRADGPLTLAKTGIGTLKLRGALGFAGGLSVDGGAVEIDTPEALGGGDLSFGTGGQLAPQTGGTLDRKLYISNQSWANDRSTRLVVPAGSTLALTRGIEIPRAYEYGGFAIQPYDNGVGPTKAVMSGGLLGYLDLYLLGDGPQGTGAAEHDWTNVRGGLRKLASGHDTRVASRIVFGEGCDFMANWFDIAGTNAVVSITNNAVVRALGELRFVDGNASQLSLDGGTLRVNVIGVANANNQHLSLKPMLFNGTVIEATQSSDLFMNLSLASAAPLLRNGGAIFDTQAYSVAIRGKGFAQEQGSSGALVKLGTGTLKIATPMSYTGATLVSNGTLRLDFALWNPTNALENLLPAAAEIRLSEGAALEVIGSTNASGAVLHKQSLGTLVSTGAAASPINVTQAELAVSALQGAFVKTGPGTFAIACGPDGSATLNGALTVQEGLFAVRGARANVTVAVPYPSFESNPLLLDNAGDKTNMDKRGTAATGCPGWTFAASSGNNQAGYQRNNSYFSTTAAAQTTGGVQTALIRQNGSMQTTLTFPTNGTYALQFRYCSRYYTKWYTNEVVRTLVDGKTNDTLVVNNQAFLERTVNLGYLAAGAHTLRFAGSYELPSPDNDPCALIDDVRITGVSDAGGANGLSNDAPALSIMSGALANLDYAGEFKVGVLVINGVTYRGGTYGAATHPEIFSGTGLVRSKASGTRLLLR